MQKQMLPSLAVLTNSVTGSVSFDKQPNISRGLSEKPNLEKPNFKIGFFKL